MKELDIPEQNKLYFGENVSKLPISVTFETELTPSAEHFTNFAFSKMQNKLGDKLFSICDGLEVHIGNNLGIQGGGLAFSKDKKILLEATKNALSLSEVDAVISQDGFIKPGEWARVLSDEKDYPWSSLAYQLIHEVGHVIEGQQMGEDHSAFDPSLSPTTYGQRASNEAFAEAFTYWVLGQSIPQQAETYIIEVLRKA